MEEIGKEQIKERIPAIQVRNLYKVYRVGETKVYALNGVDFTMYKGEFCAIVGTSGSGKSTLLNMLAGLEKPTKGEIVIAGKHIEKLTENQLVAFRRKHVGFIFQSYNLLPNLTATENVALPLMFRGIPKAQREQTARELLQRVGLGHRLDHFPRQMSGGPQQRVGIARAFITRPDVIFADEPTGNLDSKTSAQVMEMICSFARDFHQTVVLVSHDPEMVSYSHRVVTLLDGEIVRDQRNQKEDLYHETTYHFFDQALCTPAYRLRDAEV